MTGQPLVSVLIPMYNHAAFIEACLESVLQQSYQNIELIVLDDGSRDDSYALAMKWCERNAERFSGVDVLHQDNAGVVPTLNRLVKRANGAYLALLASDDALTRESIAVRVNALEAHPQWLAVFADAITIDTEGNKVHDSTIGGLFGGSPIALADERWRTAEAILKWSAAGPTFMARSTAYDPRTGVGPYDETMSVEDRDFYLRLLARGALGFVNDTVAYYRLAQTSMSRGARMHQTRLEVSRAERKNAGLFPFPYNVLLLGLSATAPRSLGAAETLRSLGVRALMRLVRMGYVAVRHYHFTRARSGRLGTAREG